MAEAEMDVAAMRANALPDQLRLKRNRSFAAIAVFLVFLLDQATKWVVTYPLQLEFRREIRLVEFFDLRWVENNGVSLGLLSADGELGR
ncbi:MAG TPA: signal peptidase II, partial [Allosphingosinicella sp.]|nr:signal peptidase II [Allosphingosinicella sp.]